MPKHLVFIDRCVPEWEILCSCFNQDTVFIPYSTADKRSFIQGLVPTGSYDRLGLFFSTSGPNYDKLFLESQTFFHPQSIEFLQGVMDIHGIPHLDIVSCKVGAFPEWQPFLHSFPSVSYSQSSVGNSENSSWILQRGTLNQERVDSLNLDSIDVEPIYFNVDKLRKSWFHILDRPPRFLSYRLEWNIWEPHRETVLINGNYIYADIIIDINNITPVDLTPAFDSTSHVIIQPKSLPPWLFKIGMYVRANDQLYVYGADQFIGMYYSNYIGPKSNPTVLPIDWLAPNIVGQNGFLSDMYSQAAEDPNTGYAEWKDGFHFYFCSPNRTQVDIEGYFLTQELVIPFAEVHPFSNVVVITDMAYSDSPYKINLLYYYSFEPDAVLGHKALNCNTLNYDANIVHTATTLPIVGQQYLSGPMTIDISYNTFTPVRGGMTFAFWYRMTGPMTTSLIKFRTGTDIHELKIQGQTLFWYSSSAPTPVRPVHYDPKNLNIAYIDTGEWIHMAMTFDQGTGIIRWFRNGLEQYVQSQMPFPPGLPIRFIGMGPGANLDEVRIYDGALTHEDIYSLAHYNKVSNPLLSVPYPPRNPRVSNPTLTTIDVAWDAPLYSTTEDLRNIVYTIVAEPEGNRGKGQQTQDYPLIFNGISNPFYTVTGLAPSNTYSVRIFAKNQVGTSLPSILSEQIGTKIRNLGGFDLPPTIATGNGLLYPSNLIQTPIFSNNSDVYYQPNTVGTGIGSVSNIRAKRLRC